MATAALEQPGLSVRPFEGVRRFAGRFVRERTPAQIERARLREALKHARSNYAHEVGASTDKKADVASFAAFPAYENALNAYVTLVMRDQGLEMAETARIGEISFLGALWRTKHEKGFWGGATAVTAAVGPLRMAVGVLAGFALNKVYTPIVRRFGENSTGRRAKKSIAESVMIAQKGASEGHDFKTVTGIGHLLEKHLPGKFGSVSRRIRRERGARLTLSIASGTAIAFLTGQGLSTHITHDHVAGESMREVLSEHFGSLGTFMTDGLFGLAITPVHAAEAASVHSDSKTPLITELGRDPFAPDLKHALDPVHTEKIVTYGKAHGWSEAKTAAFRTNQAELLKLLDPDGDGILDKVGAYTGMIPEGQHVDLTGSGSKVLGERIFAIQGGVPGIIYSWDYMDNGVTYHATEFIPFKCFNLSLDETIPPPPTPVVPPPPPVQGNACPPTLGENQAIESDSQTFDNFTNSDSTFHYHDVIHDVSIKELTVSVDPTHNPAEQARLMEYAKSHGYFTDGRKDFYVRYVQTNPDCTETVKIFCLDNHGHFKSYDVWVRPTGGVKAELNNGTQSNLKVLNPHRVDLSQPEPIPEALPLTVPVEEAPIDPAAIPEASPQASSEVNTSSPGSVITGSRLPVRVRE